MFEWRVLCSSRCSWTWWRTTRPVCGFWFWRRTTSVRSCSSRSVTCCPKGRRTTTARPRPYSPATPPAAPCCQSETSTSQSETSTSPPPGSPTAVRAEPSPSPHPLSPQTIPLCTGPSETPVCSNTSTGLGLLSQLSYWFYWYCLS